ncbi:hypothetical protein D9M68_854280 [compost metagenome]
MHTIIDHADAKEERARNDTVREHLEDCTLHALLIGCEDTHGDIAHVRNRRICDQLFDIFLHQSHKRGVDDSNCRECKDERSEIGRCQREHRQRETQETIAAELQKDTGQNDRACCWCFNVRIRQPCMNRPHWHLDCEGREECQP